MENLANALQPFLEARAKGRLAFLVGAGISKDAPANQPLASDLSWAIGEGLWNLSTIAKKMWKRKTVCRRILNVRFENLMQMIADTTGSTRFLNVLKGGKPNSLVPPKNLCRK